MAAAKSLNAIPKIMYLGWGGMAGPDRLTWGGDHTLFGVGECGSGPRLWFFETFKRTGFPDQHVVPLPPCGTLIAAFSAVSIFEPRERRVGRAPLSGGSQRCSPKPTHVG